MVSTEFNGLNSALHRSAEGVARFAPAKPHVHFVEDYVRLRSYRGIRTLSRTASPVGGFSLPLNIVCQIAKHGRRGDHEGDEQ